MIYVRPRVYFRSYSNPASQGTLIKQTKNWNESAAKDCDMHSAYIDRMEEWDRNRFFEMVQMMGGKSMQQCGIDHLVERCRDEVLIAAASYYFKKEVEAVRWVYYFNVSNGYPCERIDYIYKARHDQVL